MSSLDDMARDIQTLKRQVERLTNLESGVVQNGTWTPAFTGTTIAGTFTYVTQAGHYVLIGNLIYIQARITISAINVAPTGNMTITGLPFTANAVSSIPGVAFSMISNFKYTAAALQMTGRIPLSTAAIQLFETFTNAGIVAVPAANFTNAACDLGFIGCYERA